MFHKVIENTLTIELYCIRDWFQENKLFIHYGKMGKSRPTFSDTHHVTPLNSDTENSSYTNCGFFMRLIKWNDTHET